jgi:hypothetical protein
MPALITEEFKQWANACPLLSRDDYRYSEVVLIIHQGHVVGCDVRLKARYTATSPPCGGDDSDHNKSEPSSI